MRAAVILAAGHGKRMRSELPKVMHPVLGRPMVLRVADAASGAGLDSVFAVVGHGRNLVTPLLQRNGIRPAVQEEQLGTAHALRCGLKAMEGRVPEEVCVLLGDVPLIRTETVRGLVSRRRETGSAVTVLTTVLDDPSGYGRVVREEDGDGVLAIVEDRDATAEQKMLREINTGLMAFDGRRLPELLAAIGCENAQGEYYLTDAVSIAVEMGLRVTASVAEDSMEVSGVNNPVQLAACTEEQRWKVLRRHLMAGVAIPDPTTVWIEDDVTVGAGTTIGRLCRLSAGASVGSGCVIGDGSVLEGVHLADHSVVEPFTVMRG